MQLRESIQFFNPKSSEMWLARLASIWLNLLVSNSSQTRHTIRLTPLEAAAVIPPAHFEFSCKSTSHHQPSFAPKVWISPHTSPFTNRSSSTSRPYTRKSRTTSFELRDRTRHLVNLQNTLDRGPGDKIERIWDMDFGEVKLCILNLLQITWNASVQISGDLDDVGLTSQDESIEHCIEIEFFELIEIHIDMLDAADFDVVWVDYCGMGCC